MIKKRKTYCLIFVTFLFFFSFQCIIPRWASASVQQSITIEGDLGENDSSVIEKEGEMFGGDERVPSGQPKTTTVKSTSLPRLSQLIQGLMFFWGWFLIVFACGILICRKGSKIKE